MAEVYANANSAAAHHVDTKKGVKKVRDGVTKRARRNLAEAHKTHRITLEGYFPARIEESEGATDFFTHLHAPNAMALEFGHAPSGWFAGTKTKAPAATYILTGAAIGGSVS